MSRGAAAGSTALFERLASVPAYDSFAGVDALVAEAGELAAAHPGVARLRRFGTSRGGEPLWCLTVGEAARDALVVGFPHPNEPFGGLTALHLARTLCTDPALREELGFAWHVAFCVDPDGARLNEGWFAGPLTRERYARGFYRPPIDEQVEWTFPLVYKRARFDRVLPETRALMALIDEVRPALMCSLHNGETGGVYYYLSRPVPELYAPLAAIPEELGLPLDVGEPETAFIPRLAPAIFQSESTAVAYDFVEAAGGDPTEHLAGASSSEYAARHGTLTVICEVPYWLDARARDDAPCGRTYAELLREHAEGIDEFAATIFGALAAVELRLGTAFERATRGLTGLVAAEATGVRHRAGGPESEREATVAEAWTLRAALHMQRLREGGMLLRALDAEAAAGGGSAVDAVRARFEERFTRWLEEDSRHMSGDAAPIRQLVAAQYGAILATASAL